MVYSCIYFEARITLSTIMQIIGKITKWGNSLGLRINQEIAKGLCVEPGEEVSLVLDDKSHVLTVKAMNSQKKWPFKEKELLQGMNTENAHADLLATPTGFETLE